MPKGKTPYQYGMNDSPLTVANQNGITPQQLINANPGGYPFSVGQTINIPRLGSPGAPNPYAPAVQSGNIVGNNSSYQYLPQNAPRQYQPYVNAVTPPTNFTTADSFYTPPVQNPNFQQAMNNLINRPNISPHGPTNRANMGGMYSAIAAIQQDPKAYDDLPPAYKDAVDRRLEAENGMVTNAAGTGSAEFMNTRFMQENAKNGTPFTEQLRWDPTAGPRGKFVKIGDLIRQGKLDVRTGRMRRGRGGRGGRGNQNRQGGQPPDPNERLTGFGLVQFNVGGG